MIIILFTTKSENLDYLVIDNTLEAYVSVLS